MCSLENPSIGALQNIDHIDLFRSWYLFPCHRGRSYFFSPNTPTAAGFCPLSCRLALYLKGQLWWWWVGRVLQKYSVWLCGLMGNRRKFYNTFCQTQAFFLTLAGWNFLSALVCILPSCRCPVHKVIKQGSNWVLTLIRTAHRLQTNSITFCQTTNLLSLCSTLYRFMRLNSVWVGVHYWVISITGYKSAWDGVHEGVISVNGYKLAFLCWDSEISHITNDLQNSMSSFIHFQ